MAKKTGTLAKVGKTVKKAATAAIKTADEYVVEPVGKALGLKKTSRRKTTTRKAASRASAKKRPAKRKTSR